MNKLTSSQIQQTKDQGPNLIHFKCNEQIDFFPNAADLILGLWSAAFEKKSICFFAFELNWIWSLVFGLQLLRRSPFILCKGTELNWIWSLVFGL
jgi:hypothetical protein